VDDSRLDPASMIGVLLSGWYCAGRYNDLRDFCYCNAWDGPFYGVKQLCCCDCDRLRSYNLCGGNCH
jgi:hypothetical protein